MTTVIFVTICLLLFFVTGIIIAKAMGIPNQFLNKNGILLFPGIGVLFLLNVIQVLNLIVPCRYILIPFLVFLGLGIYKYYSYIICFFKTFFRGKMFLSILLMAMLIWSFPLMTSDGLTSIQTWNNDIIYYLSSMEWLKDHKSLQEVIYHDNAPYFWCAEYMQVRTRTGFDGLGAFIMEVFQRDSHEIFSSLGIVFGIIMLFHVYFVSSSILNMPRKICMFLLVLLICSSRFEELLVYQYIPQICGIAFLILFIGLTINMMEEKKFPKGIVALVLSGIVSVYAEFCAYLLVIYFAVFTIGYIIYKDKNKIMLMLKEGILALLINPVGVYRAIKINLFVFQNAQVDMDKIDPFAGKVSSGLNAFAQGFGLVQTDGYVGNIKFLIGLGLVVCLLIFIFLLLVYIVKIQDTKKIYMLAILAFLFSYEVYFRAISYGYGEYKHLLSLTAFLLMFVVYISYKICNLWSKYKFVKIGFMGFMLCIMLSGCTSIFKLYNKDILYYYNNDVEQLEEAARLVPFNETIGISGTPASIHGMVYGLRKSGSTILANNISYFPFSKEGASRYRLYEGTKKERKLGINEKIIWNSERFYLLENTGLQSCFYGGFHTEEYEQEEIIRYTCSQESSISIYNFSQETKKFSLKFQTEKVGAEQRYIVVKADGNIIANSQVGNFFVTDPIFLKENDTIRIYLYDNLPTIEKDGRSIGYIMKDYALIEYNEEL